MDWVLMVWSVMAGLCLMLGLTHLMIWWGHRALWENLWFTLTVSGVVGMMVCEMAGMRAATPELFEKALRWGHLVFLFVTVGLLGYVCSYSRTGRKWLLGVAVGLRVAAVVANFTTGSSLPFIKVGTLEKNSFLGTEVMVPGEFVANPWGRLGQFASLVLLIYVTDASLRLWRTGSADDKRRAKFLGGSMVFFILLVAATPGAVAQGWVKSPMTVSLPFLCIVLVMGYELSQDLLRAARLSVALKANEERLTQAATAARLAMWELDVASSRVWVSNAGQSLYGMPLRQDMDIERFLATLHPDDRAVVTAALEKALVGPDPYTAEYRVVMPDGSWQWISATGKVERDEQGRALRMRGVSKDFTERKLAQDEVVRQRNELAHLSRVSMLGEMAGTLAHELNQPLAAILSNSQVGRRSLAGPQPDMTELAAILDDVAEDAKRAGGVIHGMRAMLRKDTLPETSALDLNEVVRQVLNLLKTEIISRKHRVDLALEDSLPPVRAGRVEVQQVLINLIINGLDAMDAAPGNGPLKITTTGQGGNVAIAVHDSGPGIPAAVMPRLFDSFFSTKPGGLGLGLAISRSILANSGGELLAANDPAGGAVFCMLLPAAAP
jgi:two-component system sensor kinase FixL